jgi:hypothetical protein
MEQFKQVAASWFRAAAASAGASTARHQCNHSGTRWFSVPVACYLAKFCMGV